MAMVLDAFVSCLARTLATMASDEIMFLFGVEDEVPRLQGRLERILPVLADADMRRVHDKSIQAWVNQLSDVAYDAEDIIEECKIEADKRRIHQSSSLLSSSMSVSCLCFPIHCFSHYGVLRHQFGNTIKSINQKLDDIVKDMPLLNFKSVSPSIPSSNMISRETSPFIEHDLVGERIQEDARMLIDLLLSKDRPAKRKMGVYAIVGMGGIDKTTLAQKIYNDDRLRAEFNHIPPIWVYVSRDFSDIDLLKMVIHRAGGNLGEDKCKADLDLMLYEVVKDKRILLVLDDVWDPPVCEGLLNKLAQSCLDGSRVLVTTRDISVATSMGAMHCHQVQRLSDEHGWLLLSNMVFMEDEDPTVTQNTLKDIGMRIVNKCDGLPLALKTIAGVLRKKERTPSGWEKVLENPAWTLAELPEEVMRALYLSYSELPSNIKQCFLYFALSPGGLEHNVYCISSLWIAEGFVEAKENMLMEEVATEYWKELVHRNLLQPGTELYGSNVCKMHDVLHSLARHLASDECFYRDMKQLSEQSTSSPWPVKVRRACIVNSMEAIPNVLLDHGSLRTLALVSPTNLGKLATTKLKFLRVLNIGGSSIDKLPNSIGDLTQLKYLLVSRSEIRKVPKTIGNLRNLQFFIMTNCKNLHSVPKSIINLCNLRCLALEGSELQTIPIGIGKLTNLVRLHGFQLLNNNGDGKEKGNGNGNVKQKDLSSNLEDLGFLIQLMSLTVYKLENASGKEARAATLKAKPRLAFLILNWTTCSSNVEPHAYFRQEEIENSGEVLQELCPPPCLEHLEIEGYFGLKYPSWMMEMPASFLPNLRALSLINCALWEMLPPLGLLPQLGFLKIDGACAVKSIGLGLFGLSNKVANGEGGEQVDLLSCFHKLEVLRFENMPNWEEWSWLREEESETKDQAPLKFMPCLHNIYLGGCPKLRLLPEGLLSHAVALKTLLIEGAHSLLHVEKLPHLQELYLEDSPCLVRVSNLPALRKLQVDCCGALKHVEGLGALQTLTLRDPEISSLPEWLFGKGGEESQFQLFGC